MSLPAIVAVSAVGPLAAQQTTASSHPSATEVVAANALVGGLTAGAHALLVRKSVGKAFLRGALGGVVHSAGKSVRTGHGLVSGTASIALSSVGIAMVANAGAGKPLLDELYLPLGMIRLRWAPRASAMPRVSVSLYESIVFTELMLRDGLRLDLEKSLGAGGVVFVTHTRELVSKGRKVDGITNGSAIVLSEFASIPSQTLQHESVHVRQHSFASEAWGRPLELLVRSRMPIASRLPKWLEVDVFGHWLITAERRTLGQRSVIRRLMETEAEAMEQR